MDAVYLNCISCKRDTGLDSEINSWVFNEVINKFVLNAILHHVGMSWIIRSNKDKNYEMDRNNNQD